MYYDRFNMCKMPRTFVRSKRRESRNGKIKRGLNTKVHVAVDDRGLPLKIVTSDGVLHDNQKAEELFKDFKAEYLIADKGYDSHNIVDMATSKGFKVVIPSRKNAKNPRKYDKEIYKRRHLVENFFLKIKRFRSISTRYTKNIENFQAFLTIASFMIYSKSI